MDLATNQGAAERDSRVQVTAYYPSAAREKTFPAHLEQSLRTTVAEAYQKLEEQPRPGDTILCRHGAPRTDLTPYLDQSLAQLAREGICVHEHQDRAYTLAFDIDTEAGGA